MTVYTILTPKEGRPSPEAALEALDTPGLTGIGNLVESHSIKAIAPSISNLEASPFLEEMAFCSLPSNPKASGGHADTSPSRPPQVSR